MPIVSRGHDLVRVERGLGAGEQLRIDAGGRGRRRRLRRRQGSGSMLGVTER